LVFVFVFVVLSSSKLSSRSFFGSTRPQLAPLFFLSHSHQLIPCSAESTAPSTPRCRCLAPMGSFVFFFVFWVFLHFRFLNFFFFFPLFFLGLFGLFTLLPLFLEFPLGLIGSLLGFLLFFISGPWRLTFVTRKGICHHRRPFSKLYSVKYAHPLPRVSPPDACLLDMHCPYFSFCC